MSDKEKTREIIRKNYASIARKGSAGGCCSTSACCDGSTTDVNIASKMIGYTEDDILSVPSRSNIGLGCGNPIAIANLKEGETVLDLGSGGGFDCFLASSRVGESGLVIGVDMTPDMLNLARNNAREDGYTNVDFRLGEIENLPVANGIVDVIISNCVINLSLDKGRVFKEAYRVLRTGGRLSISDVVATAEIPEEIKEDIAMMTGCIAGAEYVENIRAMMNQVGFKDIKLIPKDTGKEIVRSWAPDRNVEDFVSSYIIEAIK